MPKTTLEDADRWYANNVDHSSKTHANRLKELERIQGRTDLEVLPPEDKGFLQEQPEIDELGPEIDLARQLRVLKEEASYQAQQMRSSRGSPSVYMIFKKMFDDTVKKTLEVEREILKIQLEASQILTVDQLEESMTVLTKKIVQTLDRIVARTTRKFKADDRPEIRKKLQPEIDKVKNLLYDYELPTED
jgi:hypothetical protein